MILYVLKNYSPEFFEGRGLIRLADDKINA